LQQHIRPCAAVGSGLAATHSPEHAARSTGPRAVAEQLGVHYFAVSHMVGGGGGDAELQPKHSFRASGWRRPP
jgi:hypothetical protein